MGPIKALSLYSRKLHSRCRGATPIDLMDGDQLSDKLKGLRLGMKTEMAESVR